MGLADGAVCMRVAIVGARTFPHLEFVRAFVQELPRGVTVVTGGARGVDQAAAEAAKEAGLPVEVILPELEGCTKHYEMTRAYYARNQKIVDRSDLVIAFTHKPTGGTWDTIRRAVRAGKPVKIFRGTEWTRWIPASNEVVGGDNKLTLAVGEDETGDSKVGLLVEKKPPRRTNGGPYHMRRISLGSYAIRRVDELLDVTWAEFVELKKHSPEQAAERMFPDFRDFFARFPPGYIDLITCAPPNAARDNVHPMVFVCQRLSAELGVAFAEVFEPRVKRGRGRFGHAEPIRFRPGAKEAVKGQVVYCLDDVINTCQTMRECVGLLLEAGAHAHGVAWVRL